MRFHSLLLYFPTSSFFFASNDWLVQPLKSLHTPVDILELRVRMLIALKRLPVGLQTVARVMEHPVHRALADPVVRRPKFLRQARGAAACPAQWTGRAGDRPASQERPKAMRRLPASARTAYRLVLRQQVPPTVVLDIPVASATRRHVARASTAAQRRRVRPSSKGLSATNLACTTCVTACSMTWNITYPHDKTTILFWRDS